MTARERLRQRHLAMCAHLGLDQQAYQARPLSQRKDSVLEALQRYPRSAAEENIHEQVESQYRKLAGDDTDARVWPPLQSVVDEAIAQLIDSLPAGAILGDDFYAGVYPTGKFNASVRSTPDGTLALINLGTMLLLNQLVKVFIHGLHVRRPFTAESVRMLRRTFAGYLTGQYGVAPTLPPLGGNAAVRGSALLASAEGFILAHEIGHFALGHLAGHHAVADVNARKRYEFEADDFAVDCMLAGGIRENDVPATHSSPSMDASIFMGGPRFVLRTHDAMLTIGSEWTMGIEEATPTTHPTDRERILRITDRFAAANLPGDDGFLDAVDLWFESVAEILVDEGPITSPASEPLHW